MFYFLKTIAVVQKYEVQWHSVELIFCRIATFLSTLQSSNIHACAYTYTHLLEELKDVLVDSDVPVLSWYIIIASFSIIFTRPQ